MTDPTLPTAPPDLLPLRMLNEYAYCPRLFHFMHVEGRWEDNQFTVEGRHAHRRVDALDHVLPEVQGKGDKVDTAEKGTEVEAGDEPMGVVRSVPLASESLGLTGKLDLVAMEGEMAIPVETKRGRVPDNAERSWEPERVQLMAQGLLLREHGYPCDHGMLYFAGSRTRVRIDFTDALETRTRELLRLAKAATLAVVLPPPLEDSPKCVGCSLAGICLPDETNALLHSPADPTAPITVDGKPTRRLYPVRDDATPFYVQEQGAYVGVSKQRIIVKKSGEELASVKLSDMSQLVLLGNIQVSTQAIHILFESAIPVVYLSTSHWFYGISHGIHLRNAYDRAAQFRVAGESDRCLVFAKQVVMDKAENQRTLLRRNAPADQATERAVADIDDLIHRVPNVDSAVISAINTGMVTQSSFDSSPSGCLLKPDGRKAFIRAYDARLDQLITHPLFDYRCSWRVVIRLQARLLSRWFRGEIPAYTSVVTR